MAAAKKESPHPLLEDFEKGFVEATKREHKERRRAPKKHDVKKGEFIREVNPEDADKHLG